MTKKPAEGAAAPFHNPFSALAPKREGLPPGVLRAEKARPAPARAVVRMERKGRAGKEVTVVEKLALPSQELERWARELKQSLGCGGSVEEGALVVQGDQRERIRAWLVARGVQKVSLG
ncbi:MAG: translation initiation factor [Deltaproteobacteria bacterium]|nr:translation initiation factor [Deltaproteobacteria bacterium]